MKYDIMISGVGGQGILSIAFVVDNTAMKRGLRFKQSEVHGMAQRGGAVSSHLRISDQEIFSDLVPLASAQLLMSVEPMEALRYLQFLAEDGLAVVSTHPFVNIPDYPEVAKVYAELARLPRVILIDAARVAKEAGSNRAENMALLGAASMDMPLPKEDLKAQIDILFKRKGEKIQALNQRAFEFGLANGQFFLACREQGADLLLTIELMRHLGSEHLAAESAKVWCEVMESEKWLTLQELWARKPDLDLDSRIPNGQRILAEGVAFLG